MRGRRLEPSLLLLYNAFASLFVHRYPMITLHQFYLGHNQPNVPAVSNA